MTIRLKQLYKTYNQNTDYPVHAVQDVNLTIEQGEFVAIMGPSGSGKTTLLNLVGGIDSPTSGEVWIDDVDISTLPEKQLIAFRRDHIGFIFQDYSLLPVLTALENVEFVMQLQGHKESQCRERALGLLEQVGLKDQQDKVPRKMSGGQQQRVAVARALAPSPRFVMADEPTANLDAKSTTELLDIMQQLNETEGTTFIFSTHDPRVITRAKRVIVFEDGKVFEDRTVDQTSHSRSQAESASLANEENA
ncbi:ABC transporter ATP-binding protein [Vibrio galatheae]|uniref:ABC transporter ATP-binding protein n=1 Tax=Vibrio galatheae TaxID=579748 RepID=UPI0009FFF17F|nr:ABC transporter ATP-binding protein [Vibrio galatheae]